MGKKSGNRNHHAPLHKKFWGIIAFFLFAFCFAVLIEDFFDQELKRIDEWIENFVEKIDGPTINAVAHVIEGFGSAYVLVPLCVIIILFLCVERKLAWESTVIAISLAGSFLLHLAMKAFFGRNHDGRNHGGIDGYSFPSGHAMVSAAFYGILGYFLWVYLKKRSKPSWFVPPLTILIILIIGLSRVLIDVHHPTDILTGFAAGGLWFVLCLFLFYWIQRKKKRR